MVVWISEDALTRGVYELDVEPMPHSTNIVCSDDRHRIFYRPEWHETEEAAIAQADRMRLRALHRAKLQVERLERLIGT